MKRSKFLYIIVLASVVFYSGCKTDPPNISSGDLIITEVGATYYSNGSAWLEIYNRSSETAELSKYTLTSTTYDETTLSIINHTFTLPPLTIQPGAYVLIRGRTSSYLQNGTNLVYIDDNNLYPFWTSGGNIELKLNGITTDFIRFGNSSALPATSSEWNNSSAAALPYSLPNDYGLSLSRNGSNSDSNDASDWFLRDFATPGGPNDITSTDDLDLDGIPDESEVPGGTFAGLPLYAWGARTGQKDIFLHIDYMDSTDEGIIPRKEALQKVVDAFSVEGIALHIDVGNLYHTAAGIDITNFDMDDKSHRVPFASSISFSDLAGYANFYQYKSNYMDLARKQIFHYLLMSSSQNADGTAGSSGIAELIGNDIIISLGQWGLDSSTVEYTNELINYQASTIMHELGHNLGLKHGGNEDTNFKPNYISVMNYLYQLYGLPEIGSSEDDRYILESSSGAAWSTNYSALVNGPLTTSLVLSYSNGSSSILDESGLDEPSGLGRTGTSGADFNLDGDVIDGPISIDINFDFSSSGILQDFNDWNNLNLFFIRDFNGDIEGVSITTATDTFRWIDKAQNDFQPIYSEERPVKLLTYLRTRKKQ